MKLLEMSQDLIAWTGLLSSLEEMMRMAVLALTLDASKSPALDLEES